MSVTGHPQTDEIMAFQKKNEDLKNEVLDLKSKLLQVEQEKQELESKVSSHIVPIATQDIDAEGLVDSLSQISLKEKEISTLKEEKKALEKANKEYQDKNAKLKDRLKGKSVLQSAQHSIWDLISIEVTKFWGELRRLETKKAYIYSALEKYKKANEQFYIMHKDPVPKDQVVIKFLKYSLDEALRAFKIPDRFQMIHSIQRIVDKEMALQKVKSKIEELQKEIKEVYALLKPLNEKGLPYFWDEENVLWKKDDYDNLIVLKRNDHSQFENLEGDLKGEVVVQKLGNVFDLFNLVRQVKFPPPLIEEYIDLEIEAQQLVNMELPSKNHFKEIIKLAVKPVGVIPITQ